MEWFLGADYPFVMFSLPHLVPLAIILVLILLMFWFRQPLRQGALKKTITYGISSILIGFELGLYGWYYFHEQTPIVETLPFHLCAVSYILTIVMLLFPTYRMYEFLYFGGIGGALQALITPAAILSGYPHFTYFYFFVGHGAIVWVALYMTWVRGYRPTWKSIWRVLIMLNILLAIVIPINWLTGENYLFAAEKPAGDSLLNFLGPWPWYLFSLEAVAIVMFVIMYLPFLVKRKEQ